MGPLKLEGLPICVYMEDACDTKQLTLGEILSQDAQQHTPQQLVIGYRGSQDAHTPVWYIQGLAYMYESTCGHMTQCM
jgi:hypothetical protein